MSDEWMCKSGVLFDLYFPCDRNTYLCSSFALWTKKYIWNRSHHLFSYMLYELLLITSAKVNKSVSHEKALDLLKCKTIRNLFALNCPMEGCGISSPNEGGTIVFVLSQEPPQKRLYKPCTLWNPFPSHGPVHDCGITIANALEISQSCILFITTGLVKPQCSDISHDSHWSVIWTSSSIYHGRDQYNIDSIFQVYDFF